MKRWAVLSLIILFAFSPLFPSELFGDNQNLEETPETVEVTVKGMGTIVENNVAAARKAALDDALKLAVEQARGVMVASESEVNEYALVKDEVISKARGFVKNYNIQNEGKSEKDNVYLVTILAKVQLTDPKGKIPGVTFDEASFKKKVPNIIEETATLSKRTNQLRKSIQEKKFGTIDRKKLKKLLLRYRILLQVVNAINPPRGRILLHKRLISGIRKKAAATALYAKFIEKKRDSRIENRAHRLNAEGNSILSELRNKLEKGKKWKIHRPGRPPVRRLRK